MSKVARTAGLWVLLLMVVFLAWHFAQRQDESPRVPFDDMLTRIEHGEVSFVSIRLQGNGPAAVFCAYLTDGSCVRSSGMLSDGVLDLIRKAHVSFDVRAPETESGASNLLTSWAPFILLIAFWIFFMRQAKGVNFNDMKKAVFSRLDQEPVSPGTWRVRPQLRSSNCAR